MYQGERPKDKKKNFFLGGEYDAYKKTIPPPPFRSVLLLKTFLVNMGNVFPPAFNAQTVPSLILTSP
jgi:hypothetical protein